MSAPKEVLPIGPNQCWPTEVSWEADNKSFRFIGEVPVGLSQLEGHFPGNPIVPGFVLISWAMAAVERHSSEHNSFEHLGSRAGTPQSVRRIKFLQVLRPGDRFVLAGDLSVSKEGRHIFGFSFEQFRLLPLEGTDARKALGEGVLCSGAFEYE